MPDSIPSFQAQSGLDLDFVVIVVKNLNRIPLMLLIGGHARVEAVIIGIVGVKIVKIVIFIVNIVNKLIIIYNNNRFNVLNPLIS